MASFAVLWVALAIILGNSARFGWRALDWLVDLLVKLLAFFHWIFGGFAGRGDWGLAIIALVVVLLTK